MAALDERPLDATARVRLNAYNDIEAEKRRKRIAEEQALKIQEEQNARAAAAAEIAKAEAARQAQEAAVKAQMPIAAVDLMQWAQDPRYQVPAHQSPPELRQHFLNAYTPEVAAQFPEMHNKAVADATGKIPGLDDNVELKSVNVGPTGEKTSTYAPKTEPEGIVFPSREAAEAADYSTEGAIPRPDGSILINKMARVDKSRGKFTEAESKSILYLDRMIDAEKGIQAIMAKGFDPTSKGGTFDRLTAGSWANFMSSPEGQMYENEQSNFLAGVLRKDTGAAVTDKEFKIYTPMFFPLLGDSKATVEQKARKRQVAMDAIKKGLSTDLIIKEIDAQGGNLPPAANSPAPTTKPTPPKVGEIRDGYRYIGPDPASKDSWQYAGPTGG